MKEIQLTQGKVAIVDDEDFEELSKHKWCARRSRKTFYAGRNVRDKNGKRYTVLMHRIIMKTIDGLETDHTNGDGLDNTRANLRVCTRSQNARNRGKQRDNTSGFKGVFFKNARGKWRAQIRVGGKQTNLGDYSTAEDAYRAYCDACIKFHGDFANVG